MQSRFVLMSCGERVSGMCIDLGLRAALPTLHTFFAQRLWSETILSTHWTQVYRPTIHSEITSVVDWFYTVSTRPTIITN